MLFLYATYFQSFQSFKSPEKLPSSKFYIGFTYRIQSHAKYLDNFTKIYKLIYVIFSVAKPMADRRRTSQTQMAALTTQLDNQNDTLRNMLKVANQTDTMTNNIQGELQRQRGVLQNNVEKNKEIKHELKKADKKTNEMRRRNLCIKGVLWIVILLLFATNIGLIIYKAKST